MKQIQWFPGHMSKALREIKEKLNLVDIVFELRDARAPLATANPVIEELIQNKKRIIVLTKKDLAHSNETKKWIEYYEQHNILAIDFDVHRDNVQKLVEQSEKVLKEKIERDKKRGMKIRPIRAMILGVPNVGKSTLINQLVKKKSVKVANTPGVTRQQQWIRIHPKLELLDTPGVLWPKFEIKELAIHLALLGTIKDTIIPKEELIEYAVTFLQEKYPHTLAKRYDKENGEKILLEDSVHEILVKVGKNRNILSKNQQADEEQTIQTILYELREGDIGKISLDIL